MTPFHYFVALLILLALIFIFDVSKMLYYIHNSSILIKNAAKYERLDPSAPKHILIVGDSTAFGTGASKPEDSVAGRFGAMYPDAEIKNLGVNGQKIHELRTELDSMPDLKADLLVIDIGGNDIFQFTSFRDIESDLYPLLIDAKKISSHVAIIHSGRIGNSPFFPRYLAWIVTDRSAKMRDLYMAASAKNDVAYVDLFGVDDTNLANDLIHPNSKGYEIWFEKIKEALINKYGTILQ